MKYVKYFLLTGFLIALSGLAYAEDPPKTLPKTTIQQNLQQPQSNTATRTATPSAPVTPTQPQPTPTAPTASSVPTAANPPTQTAPLTGATPTTPTTPQTPGVTEQVSPTGEELVYLNVQDADIKDVIKQISKATGRNFIIDDKIRGKITIISERPMTREEAYQTFLSALEVTGFTIVKGPAGVIKVIPLKQALQKPIPTHVDTTPITDMFITRLIPLQNISAVDMSNAIKGLVSSEGNLFAYPATNTLIITDSGTNIDRLMKIIKELDQEGPQQVLEIIPVTNATARDIATMVNQLFDQQKMAAGGKTAVKKGGGELEEIQEVSKIIPDERTNAIIVLASRRAIDKVRGIIAKLDRKMEEGQEGKIHVYYLKHAKAKVMAETLATLTSGAGAVKKDAKAGAASSAPILADFEGGMKITADDATNSLVIIATPKDYQTLVEKVVLKLDVARRQVYLESVVMELSVKRSKDYGLGGAFGGGTKGPIRLFGSDPFSGLLGGLASGTFGTASGPSLPSGLLGGLLGRDSVPISIGGQTREIPSIGVFISALAGYGDANVISTPNILTLDNEEAKIEVKETEYYKTSTISTTGTQYGAQSTDVGLILKITPQIGEADNIRLKIEQSLSGFTSRSSLELPPGKKDRSISTSVVTKDGQTVVLGGLMEDKTENTKSKVPILGDIPILGNLFKHTTQTSNKVNLLVFITPHIVKDASDFSQILKRKIEERNQFIENNYGRKQRAAIRQSIKNHREDLLEFKGDFQPATSVQAPQPIPIMQKPPVITAPQQPQTELGETNKVFTQPAQVPLSSTPMQQPLATVVEPQKAAPVITAPVVPPVTPQAPASKPVEPGRVKAPVITVPPPAPGAREDELNLAY